MATINSIRQKLPQLGKESWNRYNDADLAAAIWNTYYKDKIPFEQFALKVGFLEGAIPGVQPPSMPASPEQREQETRPSLAGKTRELGERVLQNVQAVPVLGGAAGGLAALSKLPGASRLMQTIGSAAGQIVPKTTKEMLAQAGKAGALAPVGLAGEELVEPALKAAGQVVPAQALREPERRRALAEALRVPAGVGAELLASGGLSQGRAAIQRKLAERPAGIPAERLEAARKLEEAGGKMPSELMMRGSDVSRTMEVFNRKYNKLVGNPDSKDFGYAQFQQAKNRLNSDYESILGGKQVTFDPKFFADIKSMLDRQRSLGETGVMFAESRPIINTLAQISQLPQNLRVRINALRDIPPETQDINVTRNALAVIDDSLSYLRDAKITMDAKIYNQLRSDLGEAAYRSADKNRSSVIRGMQKAFDDAADRSLPREDVARLKETRNRWENLKILEEAQKVSEPGLILPQNVGQVTKRRSSEGMIYGDKEMYDIGSQGISLGIRPSAADPEFDVTQVLPTAIGGPRQKVGIAERGYKAITEPIKARQVIKGPVSEEEVLRRQAPQEARALTQGIERELEDQSDATR